MSSSNFPVAEEIVPQIAFPCDTQQQTHFSPEVDSDDASSQSTIIDIDEPKQDLSTVQPDAQKQPLEQSSNASKPCCEPSNKIKFSLVDTKTYGQTTDDPFFQSPKTETFIEVDLSNVVYPPWTPSPSFKDIMAELSSNKQLTGEEIQEAAKEQLRVSLFKEKFSLTPIFHLYAQVLPSTTTELKYDWWTLFSVEELVRRSDEYDDRLYDIGTLYMGMGHVLVLCYEPKTKMFFFHTDGGSNGYERYDNHQRYLTESYAPSTFDKLDADVMSTLQCNVLFPYTKLENCLRANLFDV